MSSKIKNQVDDPVRLVSLLKKGVIEMHLALVLWLLFLNIRKKTWIHLHKYSSSMIYVMFFNALYYYLAKKKLPWDFRSEIFDKRIVRSLHIFLINPLLILLFLSSFPKSLLKQIIYILKWLSITSSVEWFALKKYKAIFFQHGWNMWWSALVYLKMFVFSYLLTKKPVLTVGLSTFSILFFLIVFKIPLRNEILRKDQF